MPTKRASTGSNSRNHPAKAARIIDSNTERCQCVLDLIDEFCADLPSSCLVMLREMIPLSLATTKQERHRYQAAIVEAVSEMCKDIDKEWHVKLRQIETEAEEGMGTKSSAEARMAAAQEEEKTKSEAKAAATIAHESVEAALKAASKTVQDAHDAAKAAEDVVVQQEQALVQYEAKFAEYWPPLAQHTFSPKDWRIRNKTIDLVVELMKNSPASLRDAIYCAFKEKPEARGPFTQKVVELAEVAIKEEITNKHAEIASLKTAATEAQEHIKEAEQNAAAAKETLDRALDVSIAAENDWVESNSVVFNLKKEIADLERDQSHFAKSAEGQKTTHERFRDLVSRFEALGDSITPERVLEPGPEVQAEACAVY